MTWRSSAEETSACGPLTVSQLGASGPSLYSSEAGPGAAPPPARRAWCASRAAPTSRLLGRLSRTLYLELGDRLGIDSGFQEHGYYIMAQSEGDKNVFLELINVRADAGVDSAWVEPEEGKLRFHDLDWDLFTGATYCAQ